MRFLLVLAAVLSLLGYQVGVAKGFQLGVDVTAKRTTTRSNNVLSKLHASSSPGNYLLDEFKTASGELVDPYKILKISRDAERTEIRQQYLTFSKKYHPDGAKHRDVLPGNW
jgi:DnaJ-class molecular chaperone